MKWDHSEHCLRAISAEHSPRVAQRPLHREAQGTRRAENPGALSFGTFSLGEQRKDTRAQRAWRKQLLLKILEALSE